MFRDFCSRYGLTRERLRVELGVSEHRAAQLHSGRLSLTAEELALLGEIGASYLETLRHRLLHDPG